MTILWVIVRLSGPLDGVWTCGPRYPQGSQPHAAGLWTTSLLPTALNKAT